MISSEFVQDDSCQQIYKFAISTQHKPLLMVMVGKDREWQNDPDIGAELATQVSFFCFVFGPCFLY